jgi:hypothetical protein
MVAPRGFAVRVATAAEWTSDDDILAVGEWGYESDTGKAKIGDGSTAWTSLAYFGEGGGGVLGVTAYRAGTDTTVGSTSSTTLVDVDATNAAVTATVPASGQVVISLEGFAASAAATAYGQWGVRVSSTIVAGPDLVFNATAAGLRARASFLLTGLTPGSTVFKFAHCTSNAGDAVSVLSGPTFGTVFMGVWAA